MIILSMRKKVTRELRKIKRMKQQVMFQKMRVKEAVDGWYSYGFVLLELLSVLEFSSKRKEMKEVQFSNTTAHMEMMMNQ